MSKFANPRRDKQEAPTPGPEVLKFVNGGGSVAAAPAEKGKGAQHPLKFPDNVLFERLERARQAGAVKLPRNTWILQAIAEKLEREGIE